MKLRVYAFMLVLCLALLASPVCAATARVVNHPPAQAGDGAATSGESSAADEEVLAHIAEIKAAGEPFLSTFNTDAGDWDTNSSEDVERSYGPGVYAISVKSPKMMGWSSGPVRAADFYVEVDTYHVAGPVDNEFGLTFRNDGDNYYAYGISSDGYFRLQKWLDGEWQSIVDWAEAPAINKGEGSHNVVGLLAEGDQISVLANGQVLATATDDSIQGDELGLAASSFDEAGVVIAFEDFKYWSPTGEPTVVATEKATPTEVATPTEEATPTEAATPTEEATPEPVSTPDSGLMQTLIDPIRNEAPDVSDDFRSVDDRWPTAEYDEGLIAFAHRGLNIKISAPNYALWTAGQEIADLKAGDALVEADVTREQGASNATYGLMVRFVDNDNYYYFGISGEGTFSFWRVVAGEWTKLADWTKSDVIMTADSDTNRLGVLAQGDRFVLMANDTPLADVQDATLGAGGAGFYAGTYAQGDLDVTFDDLDIWVLTQGEAAPPVDEEALAAAQTRAGDVKAGDAAYTTRFTRDDGTWSTGSNEGSTVDVQRGRLRIDVTAAQWLAWSEMESPPADFLLEVDTTMDDNTTPGEAGIVFRKQDEDNFYFMAIDNTGRASVWKKANGQWEALAPWEKTDELLTEKGAENRIGVLVEGSQLTALVNGKVVATAVDDAFADGTLALAVGSFASPNVAATYDNVTLWEVGGE